MRKDVKFGMALSLVAVVVAGWYFTRDESQEESIPLAADAVFDAEGGASVPDALVTSPEPLQRVAGGEEPTAERQSPPQAVSAAVPESPTASQTVASQATVASQVAVAEKVSGDAPQGVLLAADRSVFDKDADSPVTEDGEAPPFLDLAKALGVNQTVQEEPTDLGGAGPATSEMGIGAATKTSRSPAITRTARSADPKPGGEAIEIYKVQPGDSFAVLAEVYYGSQRYTQFLMDANPRIVQPEDLRVGMLIRIPPLSESLVRASKRVAVKAKAKAKPKAGERFYVVKKNDSFYRIAQRELGSGARWRELFEMNKSLVDGDSNGLRPGMKLRLPK